MIGWHAIGLLEEVGERFGKQVAEEVVKLLMGPCAIQFNSVLVANHCQPMQDCYLNCPLVWDFLVLLWKLKYSGLVISFSCRRYLTKQNTLTTKLRP
jgi:hypothetical protein